MTGLIFAIFVAVGLLSYGVLSMVFADDRVVSQRLRGMTAYEVSALQEAEPVLKSFRDRFLRPVGHRLNHFIVALGQGAYRERLRCALTVAGTPGGLTPEGYIAIKAAVAFFVSAMVLIGAILGSYSPRAGLLVMPVAAVLSYMVPNLWLRNITEHRQAAIRRELPDMLDMLTISVEAGLGFDAAVSRYVKNSDSVLAMEFGRALQETQAGATRKEALRRVSERTDVSEVRSFISAMVQAELLGTSVATVLRTQSHEMRLRRRQHAEEAAQKLPVKQVFPVVLCILPATLIVVLGPAVISLLIFLG